MQETKENAPENTSDTEPSNTNTEQKQNNDIVRYDDWGNEIGE